MVKAFEYEALWNKSKMFVDRALQARDDNDDVAFHLWASVALELLGKASLAHIHPALVADPSQFKSLLAACGRQTTPAARSISAKTVFERLRTTCYEFDERMSKECMTMANRRNAELHSGDSPVVGLDPRSWVPSFWKAVSVLLSTQDRTLKDWIGQAEADRVQKILQDSEETATQTVLARIERRSSQFAAAFPEGSQKRTDAEQRARLRPAPITDSSDEAYDETYCPACGLRGWVLGYEWDREVIDEQYEQEDYPYFLTVLVRYGAEGFRCEECDLILEGHDEIEVADMPTDFEREQEEEPDYEPDYGND